MLVLTHASHHSTVEVADEVSSSHRKSEYIRFAVPNADNICGLDIPIKIRVISVECETDWTKIGSRYAFKPLAMSCSVTLTNKLILFLSSISKVKG